jgi:hypothetical protein
MATISSLTNSELTASKVVFTDENKKLTSTGIGTNQQAILGDGSLKALSEIGGTSVYGDVRVYHLGAMTGFSASTDSDAARGTALMTALASAVSGDIVYVSSGSFDIGENFIDLSLGGTGSISIIGAGKKNTAILSDYWNGSGSNCIIETAQNSLTADLSIIAKGDQTGSEYPPFTDGIKGDYAWGVYSSARNIDGATLKNVYINAGSDGVYIGTDATFTDVYIDNVDIETVWDTIRLYPAGGTTHIKNCSFYVNLPDNNMGRAVAIDDGTVEISNTKISYDVTNNNSSAYAFYNTSDTATIRIDNIIYGVGAGTGNSGIPCSNIYGKVIGPTYYPKAQSIIKVREQALTASRPHGDTYIGNTWFITTDTTPAKLIKFTDLDNDLSAYTEVTLTGYNHAGAATTDGTYVYISTDEAVLKFDPSDDSFTSIHDWSASEVSGDGSCITYFSDYLYLGTFKTANQYIYKMDLTGTIITSYSGVGVVHSITPVMGTNYLVFSNLDRQVGRIDLDTDTVTTMDVELWNCDDLVSIMSDTVLVTSEKDALLGVLSVSTMTMTYHISMAMPVWSAHMSQVDASVYYAGSQFAVFDPSTSISRLYNLPDGVPNINEIFITSSGKIYGTNFGYGFSIYELSIPVADPVSAVVVNNDIRTTYKYNDVKIAGGLDYIYLSAGVYAPVDFRIDESGRMSDYAKKAGAVADGTYTMGIGTTTNGTITIVDGIITAVQEAT